MKKSHVMILGVVGIALLIVVVSYFSVLSTENSEARLAPRLFGEPPGFIGKVEAVPCTDPENCDQGGSPGPSCYDSDGGSNIFQYGFVSGYNFNHQWYWFGDRCYGSYLIENFCDINYQTRNTTRINQTNCADLGNGWTCQNGACVGPQTPICTDSDGGYNLPVRGTASLVFQNGTNASQTDFCASGTSIYEYYCNGNSIGSNYTSCLTLGPNYNCQNGACVNQANSTNQTYSLSVSKTGTGSGIVTSSPSGINCGSDCSENYNSGTSITLTATPSGGSVFGGWSGSCSGTGSCVVSMTQNRVVIANFIISNQTNSTNSSLSDLVVTNLTVTNKTFLYSNNTGNGTINYYRVHLTATVRNIGNAAVLQSITQLGVDGIAISNTNVFTGSLSPGSSTAQVAWIQNVPQGTRTARATADYNLGVSESNENNNQLTQTFTVP